MQKIQKLSYRNEMEISQLFIVKILFLVSDLTQKRHNSPSGRVRGRFLTKRNLFLRKVS